MKYIVLASAAILMTGCGTPSVMVSNPVSVVIENGNITNIKEIHLLAEEECLKYNKHAIRSEGTGKHGIMNFRCE